MFLSSRADGSRRATLENARKTDYRDNRPLSKMASALPSRRLKPMRRSVTSGFDSTSGQLRPFKGFGVLLNIDKGVLVL